MTADEHASDGPEGGTVLAAEFPPSAPGSPVAPFPFVERLGMELLHGAPGRTVMRLPIEPNRNHVGTMYAGALYTLAEAAGGHLFVSTFDIGRFYPVVGELTQRYRQPALTSVLVDARMGEDEVARVTSELEERGRSRWHLDLDLVDEQGAAVATTKATFFGLAL